MASALDKRLEKLVTRNYSNQLAGLLEQPQLSGLDDPDELGQALLQGWAVNGLGSYDEGLDGFFKKVLKNIKRTAFTAPLKSIKATVKTITTGKIAPMKAAIKEEIAGIKDDLKTSAPVAAVVANVVPGVGQVVAGGIAVAGAALKAKEEADKQKALQAAQEAENAKAIAAAEAERAASVAAQAASDAAKQKAIDDAKAAQVAAEKAQNEALEAQRQAQLAAQAQRSFYTTASRGLLAPGMSPEEVGTAVAQSEMLDRGYNFASPESQAVLEDTVKAYQPVVAGGGFDLKKAWPLLLLGVGVLYMASRGKRRGKI